MKIILSQFAAVFTGLLVLASGAYPCTAVFLHKGDVSLIGRTLDWPTGDGLVLINPRGLRHQAVLLQDHSKPAEWTATYGSVTFNMIMEFPVYGKMDGPVGGMNEKGLWAGTLWLNTSPAIKYPGVDGRPSLNTWQLVSYLLDTSASVREALDRLAKVRVAGFRAGDLEFAQHWMLADASGDSAAIEFPNGTLAVHRPARPEVMTNNFYEASRDYLKGFTGFGGTTEIPMSSGELTSQNRFLFACVERERLLKDQPLTLETAFAAVQKSTQTDVRHASTSQSITQWTEAYDLNRRVVQWTTRGNLKPRQLDLNQEKLGRGVKRTKRSL